MPPVDDGVFSPPPREEDIDARLRRAYEESGQERVRSRVPQYLTPDMFSDLLLPDELPPYEGGGSTSFERKHDPAKLAYLSALDIPLPEDVVRADGEILSRPWLVTCFIVVGHVLAVEELRRRGIPLSEVLPGVNRKLHEVRVNQYGDRRQVGEQERVEDVYRRHGFSCNPTLQVTEEELHRIVEHVVWQLSE